MKTRPTSTLLSSTRIQDRASSFPLSAFCFLLFLLLSAPLAQAATYYWDSNDGTAGFGSTAGTWSAATTPTTTAGWTTDINGGTAISGGAAVTTNNTNNTTDALNFGTAANGLFNGGSGTITVSGTVSAGDITFGSASGAVTLSSGTITLSAPQTMTVNNTTDTISSILGGAGTSLTKFGTGTLILSGANTYTGNTTVSAGTLTLATGGSLYNTATAATITVSTGANLNITSSATNVTNSAGNGATAKTWTVGGTINVTGGGAETLGTTVNLTGGTLTSSGATNAFGSYYVNALGTSITATGANLISGNAIGITSALTLSPTGSSDSIAVSAILGISGSAGGSLVKTGAGTVTLSGANIYTGTTSISAGTLKLQGGAFSTTARTYSISSGAVLNLDGNTSIATGTTTINGAGTLRITGGQLSTAVGSKFINMSLGAGGLIDIQAGASTAGYFQAVTWTSNLASLNLDGSFDVWDGNSPTVDALTGSGSFTKGTAATTQTITVGAANGSGTFSGTISNAFGAVNLTKNGTGTQTLSGANTYTGTTTVSAGTLALGIIGTTGAKLGVTAVTVNSGGTFAVIPGAVTTTANSSIGSTLTLNSGAAFTMADTVANQFNVAGAATLAPASGTAPVLTFDIVGNLTDKLAITGAATVGAGGAKITIAPSTTALTPGNYTVISAASGLNTNFSLTSSVVSNTGGLFTLSLSSSTATAEIVTVAANAAALYWKGAGTAWNTAGNWTTDQAGTAVSGSAPVSTTDVAFSAATPANLTTNTLTAPLAVNSVNFLPGAGSVTVVTSANALTINGGGITNNSANAMTINNPITLGAAQTWTNSGAGLLTIGGNITNAANTLTVAGTGNTTIGGVLGSGAGGLTMNGGGTLTLTGTNTFTGATTISAGTLSLGDGTANTGNLSATSAISVASGATLAVNRTGATSQATDLSGKIISGAGSFLQAGSGTTTLSLVNTYTGSTIISGGTLQIGSAGKLGNGAYAGAISIANGATFQHSSSAAQTLSGVISGGGAITKDGTTDLTLSNTGNNYTGTTTVTSGRIQATAPGNLSNGATSIVQSGTGQLYISGTAATYSNNFNISTIGFPEGDAQANFDGAIRVDGASILSGTITLSGNSRIGAYASSTPTISGKITGSAGIEFYGMNNANSSAEVFTISNTANDYTGNTTITNSNYASSSFTGVSTTLKLGNSNVIPDGNPNQNVVFAINGTNPNNTVTLDLNGFSDTINGTTVNAGANAKITNSATGASVLTIGANNTSSSFSGTITDAGAGKTLGIIKTGSGTVTLSGANSYIGATTVSAGTLALASSGSYAGSTTTVGSTGTLLINTTNGTVRTLTNNLVLTGGTVQGAQDNLGAGGTISIVGGNVVHTFLSSGTLTVPTALTAGNVNALIVGGGGGSGGGQSSVAYVAGGGGGQVLNNTASVAFTSGANTITVGTGGAGANNANAGNGTVSIAGGITAAGGLGATTTSPATTGGTSGSGQVGGGRNTTSLAGGGGGGNSAAGQIGQLGTGGAGGAGSADTAIASLTSNFYGGGGGGNLAGTGGAGGIGGGGSNAVGTANTGGGGGNGTAGGTGIVVVQYTYNPLALGGSVTLTGSVDVQSASTLDAVTTGGLLNLQGAMTTSTGTGGINIASSVATGGIVQYSTVAKAYKGDTSIGAGATLQANLLNVMPNGATAGNLVLNGVASGGAPTFDLNGFSQQINGLKGTTNPVVGTVVNNLTTSAATLTVGNNNATATFAGIIADHTSGTGTVALTKTGTGTLTLTNTSTYTGATTVSVGTLAGTGTLSASSVTISSSSVLAPGLQGGATGTFTATGADFSSGGALIVRVNNTTNDMLQVTSTAASALTMGANSVIVVDMSSYTLTGSTYVVVAQGPTWGTTGFGTVSITGLQTGVSARVGYFDNVPNVGAGQLNSKQVVVALNGNVTPVKLDAFQVTARGAGVDVSWIAVSEFKNAGFNVYRRSVGATDWTRCNSALIAGRITNADEKQYSFYDWAMAGTFEYKLESFGLNDEREAFFPKTDAVTVDWNSELTANDTVTADTVDSALGSIALDASVAQANEVTARVSASTMGRLLPSAQIRTFAVADSPTRTLAVSTKLSALSAPNAAAGVRWFTSGIPASSASASSYSVAKLVYVSSGVMLIPQASMPAGYDINHVSLQREGRYFPALAITSAGLLVYLPGYADDYTNKDAVFLRRIAGNTAVSNTTPATGLFTSGLQPNVTSAANVSAAYHDVYFDYGYRPYNFAPWFSAQYLTQGTTQNFTMNTPLPTSGSATITINLWSLTDSPTVNPDHGLTVSINNVLCGTQTWDGGNQMLQFKFTIPANALTNGANTISLTTPTIAGQDSQIAFLHSMSVDYTRLLDASQTLSVTNGTGAAQMYELYNVPAAGAYVVDTRFTDHAALVATQTVAQPDGTQHMRFVAANGGTGQFLIVPVGQETSALSITARQVKALRLSGTYLATGPNQFASGIQPLLTARAKEGVRGSFADQEALFDYYNYGRYGPDGIRKAVRSVHPTYLLLLGRTTYDYRNYSGLNIDPLCPAFLVSTSFWAQTTSDSAFGDLGRGYSEVSVGRLPIGSTSDLNTAVNRILAYKGLPSTGSGVRVHGVADRADPDAGDFAAQLATLQAAHPDLTWQTNDLGVTYQTAGEVHNAMSDAANGGADLIMYAGHGNASRLGKVNPRILDNSTIADWKGNVIFIQATCTANWDANNAIGYKSIAMTALTQPNGGISASIASSTYMNSDVATDFMNQLLKNVGASTNSRWGTVLMKTQQWAAQKGGANSFYTDMSNAEQIFGDPAMRIYAAPARTTVITGSGASSTTSGTQAGSF